MLSFALLLTLQILRQLCFKTLDLSMILLWFLFAVITLEKPLGKKTGWMGIDFSTAADETLDITTTGATNLSIIDHLIISSSAFSLMA